MRPDGISLVLLAAMAAIVLADLPATGSVALIRLLLIAVTAGIAAVEEGRGSRGFFTLCAGQAVAATGTTPAAVVVTEVLLLLLFLRLGESGRVEAQPLIIFAGMAGAVILIFSATRGLAVPGGVLFAIGLLALLALPLADYRLKRKYGSGGTHEAVQ
jgi:hypothetical protein